LKIVEHLVLLDGFGVFHLGSPVLSAVSIGHSPLN
jgi:hypothetical protein